MNPSSIKEAEVVLRGLNLEVKKYTHANTVICVPFVYMSLFGKLKIKKLGRGAQTVSTAQDGAYTGEVSASMLSSVGVTYAIVGHSETRHAGETDAQIAQKISLLLKNKITPIVCIGERTRDAHGDYLSFVKKQLLESLAGISKAQVKNIILAYEPVWAIGAGALREATVEEFIEIRIFIRKVLSDMYDAKIAHSTPILYGGSVHPENAREFTVEGGASGLLVGRDSLIPKKFGAIIAATK